MRWEVVHLLEQEMAGGAKRILEEHGRFLDLVLKQILSGKRDPYSIVEEFSKDFLSYFENQLPSFYRKLESTRTS